MKALIMSLIFATSVFISKGAALNEENVGGAECIPNCCSDQVNCVTGSISIGAFVSVHVDVRICCDCCCGYLYHQYCCSITIEFLDQYVQVGNGNYNIDDLQDIVSAIVLEDPNLTSTSQVTQINIESDAVFNYSGGGGFKVLSGQYSINKNVSGWTINPSTETF